MSVYISVELQRLIRGHFKDCCAYCQTSEHLTVTNFEFEHIRPRSAEGETNFKNLCLSCPSCNRYKSSRQTAIDPLTQKQVVLFNPQSQLWNDHFKWNQNQTEIIGITAEGRATNRSPKNEPSSTYSSSCYVGCNGRTSTENR